ncbi:MAG: helix-turn-helix domain-containing protein [Pseudonocardiaceae bacterium]|nr:helix-turn-helix domain-containing protein [Pseudonocardiaceae bacterium]
MTATTDRPIATVERAIAVLNVLAEAHGDLGTNEVARRAGLNVSSASRLLATLAAGELVGRSADTGRYHLGLRLVQLGNVALGRVDLRDVARAHLVALTEATEETATLSIPSEWAAVTVDFVQSTSSVRSVAQLGRPSASHATATGKVFLAYGGRLADGPLPAYTARTITDREALRGEIEQVSERGWGQAMGERERELNAIAAPVLDPAGQLVAILGLQGPAGRFTADEMRQAVPQLLEHASQLYRR